MHTAASSDDCYAASADCDAIDDRVAIGNVTVEFASAAPTRLASIPSSLRIDEGQAKTYTVRLATEPASDVTVEVAVDPSDSDVSVDPTSLTFTPADGLTPWNVVQTVEVSAEEDEDGVDDIVTVTHTVSGEDVASRKMAVTVRDNDRRDVTVDRTSLEIPEGADATYSVVLETEPTGTVTVAITGASGDVTVSPSQLTFRVTAPNDPNQ